MKTLLTASRIATTAGPLLEDAAILIEDGRILRVGPRQDLLNASEAPPTDLGDCLVLPGLVNAHTHLELTAVGQLPRPASFVDWILALRDRALTQLATPEQVAASTRAGIRDSIRSGVTAVGDVTLNPAVTRPLLRDSGLRGVSFGEVLGMAGRAAQTEHRIDVAIDRSFDRADGDFRAGLEPHAPYSLDLAGYRRCMEVARHHGLPLATHLAETPDEAEFLARHTGPFRRLWEALGAWQEGVSRADGGPIFAMNQLGLLHHVPTLLAHVNYVDDEELTLLAGSRASVVYCPRTHEYFDHPPHRFEDMLAGGINVALGTDSAASAPDLNLMDDLRRVHRDYPGIPVETLFRMATLNGARALGMAHRIGSIEPGRSADFCVFRVTSRDPLRELLESNVLPDRVWIGGREVYAAAPVP